MRLLIISGKDVLVSRVNRTAEVAAAIQVFESAKNHDFSYEFVNNAIFNKPRDILTITGLK